MSNSEQPKPNLAEFYRNFLSEGGYRASIDEDGDVVIRHEDGNYFVSINEDDEGYFQLVYPCFWEIESEEEREHVTAACVETTREQKAAKVFLVRDNTDVSAEVEAFLDSREDVVKVFPRYLQSLRAAVAAFREVMREKQES